MFEVVAWVDGQENAVFSKPYDCEIAARIQAIEIMRDFDLIHIFNSKGVSIFRYSKPLF